MPTVKPAQLPTLPLLALLLVGVPEVALGQGTPAVPPPADSPPPSPTLVAAPSPAAPAAAEPPASELPPPPPPRSLPLAPAPQAKVQIAAPPVPSAVPRRGYHVHDGFYLRLGAGLGGGHASVSTSGASSRNFSAGGPGIGFNLWLGGTPWNGVALGGLLSLQGVRDSEAAIEGATYAEPMNGMVGMAGVFIDAFPDDQRGLHFGGALGLGNLSVEAERNSLAAEGVDNYTGGGLGLSAWIGYMGWVGPEWSLGGMLQFTGVATGNEQDSLERRGSAGVGSLSLTAAYH